MMAAIEKVKRLYVTLGDSRYDVPYLVALLLLEAVLCSAIVNFVPYTEIDWEAYMQEVDLWQGGELDYRKIRGGTGPLVYPAGFLYLYAWLSRITRTNQGNENGHDIRQAQIVFISLYVITTAFVLAIYTRVARRTRLNLASQIQTTSTTGSDTRMQRTNTNNVWSWRLAMGLCCLSKRIHSIFVLRLFNDGPAMLLLYLSIWFFTIASWRVGCFIFSLAVSIKMNILLFAPGLLLLLLQFPPHINETLVCLGICATVQLILGAPFLLSYPQSYIRKAFEFDRVFFYKWTVNWKVSHNNVIACLST
jgi:alpha-1,3-mannosyltransferase